MSVKHAPGVGLVLVVLSVIPGIVSAAWVPLTGDPVSLAGLHHESLIVGDKEFSEFEMLGFAIGGALAPDPSTTHVQGGMDDQTGDYGLRFLMSWAAGSNQGTDAIVSFKVAILEGHTASIKDVSMWLAGVSATGTGLVSAGELVLDGPFPGGKVLASLSTSKQEGDGGASLHDHAEFSPVPAVWIRSKDISTSGGTGVNGSAHISEFFQFYSQVPEPATVLLLIVGATTALLRRRRADR